MRHEGITSGIVRSVLAIAFVGVLLAAEPVRAQDAGSPQEALPAALVPALQQIRTELALTDEQSVEAGRLLTERIARAAAAVENFGGISFDSVLDLLVEARSFRDEFVPQLSAVLTDEQKVKLAALPKAHEVYTAAMAGWFAQARTDKLQTRLHLSDTQVPEVQAVLMDEFREAVRIVEGFIAGDSGETKKSAILDLVVDLRAAQRQGRRSLERLLTPDQLQTLAAYRAESEAQSEKADKKKN